MFVGSYRLTHLQRNLFVWNRLNKTRLLRPQRPLTLSFQV